MQILAYTTSTDICMYLYVLHVYVCICMYCMYMNVFMSQDYVFIIPPPPHFAGPASAFSPSIDECWYRRVNLIFKMRVRTDGGRLKECLCALIETFYDYCPSSQAKSWWPSTAQIGTKLVYLPSPEPVLYVVPLSHILGKLPLVPAGDDGTIPWNMHGRKVACYPLGVCDRQGSPGSGSPLFYINSWAMIWPVDYKMVEK